MEVVEGHLGDDDSSEAVAPARRSRIPWFWLAGVLVAVAIVGRLVVSDDDPAPAAATTTTTTATATTSDATAPSSTTGPDAPLVEDGEEPPPAAGAVVGGGVTGWPFGAQGLRLYLQGDGVLTEVNIGERTVRSVPFPTKTPRRVLDAGLQLTGHLVLYGDAEEVGGLPQILSTRLDGGLDGIRSTVTDLGAGEFRPGWFSDSLLLSTPEGVGELSISGEWRWGPEPPPFEGRLLGPLSERRALFETVGGLVAWGPGTEPEVMAPSGSRYLGGAGDRFAYVDPTGRLFVGGTEGATEVSLDGLPIERWDISGAAVAYTGDVAVFLAPDGAGPRLVLVDRRGNATTDARLDAGLAEVTDPLTEVRWSPDARWIVAASPDHEQIVAIAPNSGSGAVLPVGLPGHQGMVVARVPSGAP